jgi:hypothetical protein
MLIAAMRVTILDKRDCEILFKVDRLLLSKVDIALETCRGLFLSKVKAGDVFRKIIIFDDITQDDFVKICSLT